MSDFLTVNGTPVLVEARNATMATTEACDRASAFDGTMRAVFSGSATMRKRVWSVTTVPLSASAAASLVTTLLASPQTTAAGDWLGGSITVWPQLLKRLPTTGSGEIMESLTFTLTEV